MNILQTIRAGSKLRKTIKYPGTEHLIDLKILTDAEEQEAEFAAEDLFKNRGATISFHNVNEFELEKTTQKLYRALRDTRTDEPLTASITEFKDTISRIERDLLVQEFNAFSEQFNPSPRAMPMDEFEALVDSLKKKPKETISNVSSFETLKKLALYLAELHAISLTDNGSISSQ